LQSGVTQGHAQKRSTDDVLTSLLFFLQRIKHINSHIITVFSSIYLVLYTSWIFSFSFTLLIKVPWIL